MSFLEVSVTRTFSYQDSVLKEAVDRHFQLLRLEEKLRPGMKVVLKPNLLMKRAPEEATTTHPAFVGAVAKKLQELGITDITVADSPGGLYTKAQLSGIYRATGMEEYSQRCGFALNQDTGFEQVSFPEGETCRDFPVIRPLLEADWIINLAKLKTHGMTGLSGAVKNMFGSVPGLQKPEFHYRFPEKQQFCNMLVDLCLFHISRVPTVHLVDAVVSMEGDGPSGGTPKKTDILFGSMDPFSLDRILADFIGMELSQLPILQNAVRRGLCPEHTEEIPIVGDPYTVLTDFQKPNNKSLDFLDRLPSALQGPLRKFAVQYLTPRPLIQCEDCIGCGKCAESCPPKTIEMVNHKAQIHYENCIRCYCCQEMCPQKAIAIRRFRLFTQ